MLVSITLIFCSMFLSVAGELLLKSGMNQLEGLSFDGIGPAVHSIITIFTNPSIFVGFVVYGISAMFWLAVLSRLDLSFAYPFLAIMYLLVPLAAKIFLGEHIPAGRWVGIAIIVIGVLAVAWVGEPT